MDSVLLHLLWPPRASVGRARCSDRFVRDESPAVLGCGLVGCCAALQLLGGAFLGRGGTESFVGLAAAVDGSRICRKQARLHRLRLGCRNRSGVSRRSRRTPGTAARRSVHTSPLMSVIMGMVWDGDEEKGTSVLAHQSLVLYFLNTCITPGAFTSTSFTTNCCLYSIVPTCSSQPTKSMMQSNAHTAITFIAWPFVEALPTRAETTTNASQ